MQVKQAARLSSAPRMAIVGSGGKTSALFQIAREYRQGGTGGTSRVLLSATSHMAIDQLGFADRHIVLESLSDVEPYERDLPEGITLFTGGLIENERIAGLNEKLLQGVLRLADIYQAPLLIEADGSRRKPIKAPAFHEPAIPSWVDSVMVVTGLSALGHPLNQEWVHRPERFAQLAGMSLGNDVKWDALIRVLTHSQGGLKNIPEDARRLLFLNQADNVDLRTQAEEKTAILVEQFHAVLVGAINPQQIDKEKHETRANKIVRDPIFAVYEPIAAILLAAGASQRFGTPKQLLDWDGLPLVRKAAQTALTAGFSEVLVISGAFSEQVRKALHDLPVRVIYNQDWKDGQSTSVRAGLATVDRRTCGAIFLLADQPFVTSSLLRDLITLHAHTLAPIVAPRVGKTRANPILFDRSTFSDLMSLSGDMGGRGIFSRYPITWLPWDDSNLLEDIDTPEDYQRIKDKFVISS
jgi:molybdenum cofactor cytidylyltransferase